MAWPCSSSSMARLIRLAIWNASRFLLRQNAPRIRGAVNPAFDCSAAWLMVPVPSKRLSMSDTALIVIDVQESFRHMPFWADTDLPVFVGKLQALIDGTRARGIPIVQILHVRDSSPFALDSGYVTTLAPLVLTP